MSRRSLLVVGAMVLAACGGSDQTVSLPGLDGAPAPRAPTAPTLPTTSLDADASTDRNEIEAVADEAPDGSGVAPGEEVPDEIGSESTMPGDEPSEPEDEPSEPEGGAGADDDASDGQPDGAAVDGAAVDDAAVDDAASDDVFLRRGDEGPEVRSMQQRLIVLEYLAAGGDTGVFDAATADALIDFQAQYGLVVDGIFGPQSDRALNAAAASVAGS
ncbi:MAG: peptidoglycan-binding domain-containing protein [Actinomycetota bacterium]